MSKRKRKTDENMLIPLNLPENPEDSSEKHIRSYIPSPFIAAALPSRDIKKTVLVLEQVSEDAVSAVFYRSYNDGKIRKEEIQSTRYRLSLCPEDVVKKILDKNCIIKTY